MFFLLDQKQKKLPIYDLFPCAGHLVAIGPYYSRVGFADLQIFLNGRETSFWISDDLNCFTLIVHIEIPAQCRASEKLTVQFRCQNGENYSQDVSVALPDNKGLVAVATMVKYDHEYIGEWIDYHEKLGIEHFYIYNNDAPKITEALRPYQRIVTEIPWPYPYKLYSSELEPFWPLDSHYYSQPPQIMHAALKFGYNWTWMGFFDCDEFMCPTEDFRSILDLLRWRADKPFSRVTCLEVSGKWFGNSQHRTIPNSEVLKNYCHCEKGLTAGIKCFVRPDTAKATRIHTWTVEGKTIRVNPDLLRYNHYRSISPWTNRCGSKYDGEFTNECESKEILRVS